FPIIGDDSARMNPQQVASMATPGFTNTPSFPIYAEEDDPSDTDPNMLVLPDIRHSRAGRPAVSNSGGDSRKWLLVGLIGAALVLALVAVLLVATKGGGKDTDKSTATNDDNEEAAEAEDEDDELESNGRRELEDFSLGELDQANLMRFIAAEGRIADAIGFAVGAYQRPAPVVAEKVKTQQNTQPKEAVERKKYVNFSFEYAPKTADVSVSGGRKRSCGGGTCTVKAEEGATVKITVTAPGRADQTRKVTAAEGAKVKAIKLFRRAN